MYSIIYLVKPDIPESDILCVYCSINRSVLEYACLFGILVCLKKL